MAPRLEKGGGGISRSKVLVPKQRALGLVIAESAVLKREVKHLIVFSHAPPLSR
jgi:hypothetical protein